MAILDLDRFKAYNDDHGHQAGDLLLKEAAAAWRAQLRPTDTLARYGGEEFVVLLRERDLEAAQPRRRSAARRDAARAVVLGGLARRADGDTARGAARPRRPGALRGEASALLEVDRRLRPRSAGR